jgi:hypothetical protein
LDKCVQLNVNKEEIVILNAVENLKLNALTNISKENEEYLKWWEFPWGGEVGTRIPADEADHAWERVV